MLLSKVKLESEDCMLHAERSTTYGGKFSIAMDL